MDVTQRTEKELQVEDRSPLLRIILSATVMAGLILPVATMKEFGPQSYYRLTYWIGGVLIAIGAVGILLLYRNSRLQLDQEKDRLWLSYKKGLRLLRQKELRLSLIDDLRIEQHPKKESYRITIHHSEEGWIPISHRYLKDLTRLKQTAAVIQAYLTQS
jgi:hypothetical protein